MAYISTERVRRIREDLKLEFPTSEGWKLSVRQSDHTSLYVSIMSSPIDFELGDHKQVNHFYLSDYTHCDTFQKIKDIAYSERYFFNLEIGQWDKPFVLFTKKVAKKAVAKVVVEKEVAVEVVTEKEVAVEVIEVAEGNTDEILLDILRTGRRWSDGSISLDDAENIIKEDIVQYNTVEKTYTQEEVEFLLKQQRDHSSFALGLSSAGMVYPRDFDKLKSIIDNTIINPVEMIKNHFNS